MMTQSIQVKNTASEQLDLLVCKQREFFNTSQTLDIKWRKKQLLKLKKKIQEKEEDIYLALQNDLGKHRVESYASELAFMLKDIDHTMKNLKRWALSESVPTPLFLQISKSKIHYQPKGCTLIIAPWNYPFQLAMAPLIGSLGAGNCALLKPSEDAPHTALLIEALLEEVFEQKYVATVQGEGRSVVSHLLQNHQFGHVFFTGSSRVGSKIMQMAAQKLSPVTLELGGKSPGIIDKKVDLQTAVKRLTWGKFYNTGQTCVAPDYLLVHEDVKSDAITHIKRFISEFYGNDPAQSPDYGRMIHGRAFDRMQRLIHSHENDILFGGYTDREKLYVAPTLIEIKGMDTALMKEEIFGPLWPVVTWKTEHELYNVLSKNPSPLAAYMFTKNRRLWKSFVQQFSCGGACRNNCILHLANPHLPFGGIGTSGMGNYHGRHSFLTFSHEKSVFSSSSWPDPRIKYPPYAGKMKWIKRLLG
jgi:aldehyde dehydrogenase (NAD+)